MYKEEELLKRYVTKNAWGVEETKAVFEEYQIRPNEDTWFGLCTNCVTFFLRRGHYGIMQSRNPNSSTLDNEAKQYNELCPKIAHGIVAWLLFHTYWDEKRSALRRGSYNGWKELFEAYREECYKRWRYANAEDYAYFDEERLIAEARKLDEDFVESSLAQEESFIKDFVKPLWLGEEHLARLVELSRDYSSFLMGEDTEDKPREYSKELLALFDNRADLLDRLIGKDTGWQAREIKRWSQDGTIPNLSYNRSKLARLLKAHQIINVSVQVFRKKL